MGDEGIAQEVGGFDYLAMPSGTVLVRGESPAFVPGSFRAFLSRVETETAASGTRVKQCAYYLPRLRSYNNPFDIAQAAVSYSRRHPELVAVFLVAPQRGLVTILVDACVRSLPGLEIRLLLDPLDASPLLRLRDPKVPMKWWEFPAAGAR